MSVIILHDLPPITTHDLMGSNHVADNKNNNAYLKKFISLRGYSVVM